MINRKKLKASEIIVAVGALLFFIGYLGDLTPLWIAGIMAIIAGVILYARVCRCPKCGQRLRISSPQLDPGYCPKCGSKIKFDE